LTVEVATFVMIGIAAAGAVVNASGTPVPVVEVAALV
jgi:hypothetical protein